MISAMSSGESHRFWDCNPFVMNVKGHVMFATKKISQGVHWMNITHTACRKIHADLFRRPKPMSV